jgi:hypothetical protein
VEKVPQQQLMALGLLQERVATVVVSISRGELHTVPKLASIAAV